MVVGFYGCLAFFMTIEDSRSVILLFVRKVRRLYGLWSMFKGRGVWVFKGE